MEPPQEEKYKIKYNGKDKEIEVIYEDVRNNFKKNFGKRRNI